MIIDFNYVSNGILPITANAINKVVKPAITDDGQLMIEFYDSLFTEIETVGTSGDLRFTGGQELDLFFQVGFRLYNGKYYAHEFWFRIENNNVGTGSGTSVESNISSSYLGSQLTISMNLKIKTKTQSSSLIGNYYSLFRYSFVNPQGQILNASFGIYCYDDGSAVGYFKPFNAAGNANAFDDIFYLSNINELDFNILNNLSEVSRTVDITDDSGSTTYHLYGTEVYLMKGLTYLHNNVDQAIESAETELKEYTDNSVAQAKEELAEQYKEYIDNAIIETSKRFVSR